MSSVRYRFGDYVLDLATRELRRHDRPVALPARVLECLCCLIEHRDRAVSRDELVQAVFGRADVSDAQLAQIVLRARRAVGDDGHEQRSIRTVPRYGFRWLEPTQVEHVADAAPAEPAADRIPDAPFAEPVSPPPQPEPLPATPIAPRRRRWWWWLGGLAVLSLSLALLAWSWYRPAPPTVPAADTTTVAGLSNRTILVLPTQVASGDDDVAWARLGLMDFVADRLHRAGLPVLSSETVLGVMREQPQKDDPQRLRQATRAAWIVGSQAEHVAADWQVVLTATDGNGVQQHGRARHADLLEATRLAADRLSPTLGGHLPRDKRAAPGLNERLQRARAAMLANEIEAARRILNEAPELQRSQPRLQYQLARVDFRAGEYQRGLDILGQALASTEAAQDPQFKARLLNARGAMLLRMDRYRDAEHTYDQVVALTGKGAHPAELGQALSGRAVAYSLQQQFDRALADLGQARVQLANMGDALAVARVDANLGILEFDRKRPAHALAYLEKATEDFMSMGALNELATTRKMLMATHLQLLRPDAALRESERAWAMLERIRDPSQRADLILTRAEVLMLCGRLREAGRLLEMPETQHTTPADHGRRDYLRMDLARRAGAAAQAVAIADAALRDWPPDRNPRLRGWMQWRRQQAALEADLAPSSTVSTLGDSLAEQLTHAASLQARGEAAAADAAYRAAIAQADRAGIPEEIAIAVDAYASWLLQRGRPAEAGALIGRVAPWATHDFDLALLQLRLYRALQQPVQWRAAYDHAAVLAGERRIPDALDPARQ